MISTHRYNCPYGTSPPTMVMPSRWRNRPVHTPTNGADITTTPVPMTLRLGLVQNGVLHTRTRTTTKTCRIVRKMEHANVDWYGQHDGPSSHDIAPPTRGTPSTRPWRLLCASARHAMAIVARYIKSACAVLCLHFFAEKGNTSKNAIHALSPPTKNIICNNSERQQCTNPKEMLYGLALCYFLFEYCTICK